MGTGTHLLNGTLYVVGTALADSISISRTVPRGDTRAFLKVGAAFLPGRSATFLLSDVTALQVILGEGNDRLKIGSTVLLPVTVYGDGGNDQIAVGGGNATVYAGLGNDTVKGGPARTSCTAKPVGIRSAATWATTGSTAAPTTTNCTARTALTNCTAAWATTCCRAAGATTGWTARTATMR